jgi:Ca-activated chloride channel homolog
MIRRTLAVAVSAAVLALATGCAGPVQQPADDAIVAGPKEKDAEAGELQRKEDAAPGRDQLARQAQRAARAPESKVEEANVVDGGAMGVVAAPPPAEPAASIAAGMPTAPARVAGDFNRENYADHADNPVHVAAESPVSTLSIDVDTGSYSNVRRMLNQGVLPPADAVRAEEMLNYFDYAYAPPTSRDVPFATTVELAPAPWNPERQLLLVGIKGYEVPKTDIPASNIVFLLDTSGSMDEPNKLPLLKESLKLMASQLRAQDRVSIVVYAGSAGLVLPPTAGDRHDEIMGALDRLSAGGSTNGGEGIQLAYDMAKLAYIDGGVNRVILATDGDFNVGTVDIEALKTMVADKRKTGVALTTLGFGEGNYNDELAEQLADIGNGNHAYIDTLEEGRKVLVDELSATTMTIAKDVKIQVEFNPQVVAEYRLIGYENRILRREDFNNDKVDAGEIGAGHDVTALYELTLVGAKGNVDPLRYGNVAPPVVMGNAELAFLKLRWKAPDAEKSQLIERPIAKSELTRSPSERLRFAAAVAAFADALRGGTHLGEFTLDDAAALAADARGTDRFGYRSEFVELVRKAQALQSAQGGESVAIAR